MHGDDTAGEDMGGGAGAEDSVAVLQLETLVAHVVAKAAEGAGSIFGGIFKSA